MNINIEIPDDLHKQLRLKSVELDTTLKALVIQYLEQESPRASTPTVPQNKLVSKKEVRR